MNNNKLLGQIKDLIAENLAPIKQQLDTLELKIEAGNSKVDQLHESLTHTIKQSQEDTIETLSALIHTGYEILETRVKKLEEREHLS